MAGTLSRLAAWAVATALAVTLSWFAVSGVLREDTPADRPTSAVALGPPDVQTDIGDDALPASSPRPALSGPVTTPTTLTPAEDPATAADGSGGGAGAGDGGASPGSSAEGIPPRSATSANDSAAGTAAGGGGPPASPVPPAPAAQSAADTPMAQSYQLDGGRVVIETTAASARLVSAIPDVGWTVQAWQAEGWLRVDFSRDGRTSSCFVTWNGHPPTVQIA